MSYFSSKYPYWYKARQLKTKCQTGGGLTLNPLLKLLMIVSMIVVMFVPSVVSQPAVTMANNVMRRDENACQTWVEEPCDILSSDQHACCTAGVDYCSDVISWNEQNQVANSFAYEKWTGYHYCDRIWWGGDPPTCPNGDEYENEWLETSNRKGP